MRKSRAIPEDQWPDHKICTKCKEDKPLEDFYETALGRFGRRSQCKVCMVKASSAHDKAHPELKRQQLQNWRESNRDRYNAWNREYQQTPQRKAYLMQWEQDNKERNHTRRLVWLRANKQRVIAYVHKRRSLINNSTEHYTVEEWLELCELYDNMCLSCGEQVILTVDHVLPLSMGGSNGIDNIQPLCKSCNCRKQARYIDYRPEVNNAIFE